MCEITRENFEEKYSEIIDNLHSASFISIDCEFTGLFDDENKCSLFDSPSVRFNKLQNSLEKYLIIQFGLSVFKHERKDNSFTASTYTFYLIPAPLAENQNFSCQIGSIEFLRRHSFDFNKAFHEGIYFLSMADETKALKMIEDGSILSKECYEEIQKHCSVVNEWSVNVAEGSEMFLRLDNVRDTFIYLTHLEIRKHFSHLRTYFEKNGVRIKKINGKKKKESNKDDIILKKRIFDSLIGFSRIMKEIQKLKKPIVGHNFLIDVIKIYQQFYNPSPVPYAEFKRVICELFPNLYDTKHMSFKLRDFLSKEESWKSNILSDLYEYLKNGKGAALVIYTPGINHTNEDYENGSQFHEAGYDSYVTGFCFLKMAHAFSLWDLEKKCFRLTIMRPSNSWLMGAITPMKNCLNVSRGQVNHIVLDGSDPKNTRPALLYIQSTGSRPLVVARISELIAKYGSVDIQQVNKSSALMAVSNKRQFKEILQFFQTTDEFTIHRYNFLKHTTMGKALLSGFTITCVLLATILGMKGSKNV